MGTNFIPDGFADFCFKKSFIPKLPFFYFIDVCGNGYLWNIVTTSLFMTLVEWLLKKSTGGQGPDVSPPLKIK